MSSDSTPLLASSQTAIIQDQEGAPKLANGVPLPYLKAGTVLVKTVAVALNPSDHKMGIAFPTPGAVVGMDFSGTVAAIHPETETSLQIGDQVCGMVHGSNPGDTSNGAFAEYLRVHSDLLLRVPESLSMAQAATLGVGLMTNIMALWHHAALALTADPESPAEKPHPVLIYGGSTATGTLATQLLKLSGLDPIVTCSPRNFELVYTRGASFAADYIQPNVTEELKKHTTGKLKHVYDCIADPMSVGHCYAVIGRTGGRYVSLEQVPEKLRTRRAVQAKVVLAYEGLGENVSLSKGYESTADPEKRALAVKFFVILQKVLDHGLLKTHPVEELEGGLSGVLDGLQRLKSGSVSGKKLVVIL